MLMEIDLGFKTEVDTFELWSSEFCFIFIKILRFYESNWSQETILKEKLGGKRWK